MLPAHAGLVEVDGVQLLETWRAVMRYVDADGSMAPPPIRDTVMRWRASGAVASSSSSSSSSSSFSSSSFSSSSSSSALPLAAVLDNPVYARAPSACLLGATVVENQPQPYLGAVTEEGDVWCGFGGGHWGFTYGAFMGRTIAAWILGRASAAALAVAAEHERDVNFRPYCPRTRLQTVGAAAQTVALILLLPSPRLAPPLAPPRSLALH